ncbi:MAG: hypothetical protein QOF62_1567 [Pyrinomonadaceae bacterium]|jgi:hypothetical protein|nr:hypothetical protein [Pyrinomonadaceae bacterium]
MASDKNKWIDAVGKLLQLTQQGSLKWEPVKPPAHLNAELNNSRVDVVYETNYKDRTLRLYEKRYKVDKPNPSFSLGVRFDQQEYPYWTSRAVLELLDENELSPWAFPNSQILNDLLEAVRYQVSGVKDFLNEILAEAS